MIVLSRTRQLYVCRWIANAIEYNSTRGMFKSTRKCGELQALFSPIRRRIKRQKKRNVGVLVHFSWATVLAMGLRFQFALHY